MQKKNRYPKLNGFEKKQTSFVQNPIGPLFISETCYSEESIKFSLIVLNTGSILSLIF